MGDRSKPEIEVIHPEVEVLPPDHFEPRSSVSGSRVWLSVDSHGGTRRVYVAKPGPIATILLALGFGVLLTVSFLVCWAFLQLLWVSPPWSLRVLWSTASFGGLSSGFASRC